MGQGCPSREELAAFRAGYLPDETFESVAGHLEACADCLAVLDDISTPDDSLLAGIHATVAADPFIQELQCRSAGTQASTSARDRVPALSPHADTVVPSTIDREPTHDVRESQTREPQMPDIPGYVMVRWIGGGGMGDVFEVIKGRTEFHS